MLRCLIRSPRAVAVTRTFSSMVHHDSYMNAVPKGRTAHITVDDVSKPVSAVISEFCLPDGMDAKTLIRTGAVYRATFGQPPAEAKRLLHDVPVYEGEYVRVHLSPRRYDVESVPWEKLVVHHDDDFIVINKPPGVPTVPTGDNYYENVIVTLQRLLGGRPLFPTQRLDTDTTGLLVIGKSEEFASHFGQLLRHGATKKTYKVLIAADAIPHNLLQNTLVHYTPRDGTIRPRVFTPDPSQFAECKLCEMTVLSLKDLGHGSLDFWLDRLAIPPEGLPEDGGRKRKLHRALENYFLGSDFGSKELSFAELELQLVTGRTHQIRGQLSAVGNDIGGGLAHVAGDNMYLGMSSSNNIDRYKSSPYLALQASAISFKYRDKLFEISLPNPWWHKLSKLGS